MSSQTFWNWFYNSSTILWARFQVLFGSIVTVLLVTDMTPWLPPKYLVMWIPINGVITEYLRRVNTQTSIVEVADTNDNNKKSDVVYLKNPIPVPAGSKLVKLKG